MTYNPILYNIKKYIFKILTIILVFCLFYPIIPLFFSIFSPNTENFQHIIQTFIIEQLLTTTGLIICTTFFCFIIAFFSSILVTFYQFPLSKYFNFLLILPLTIPTYFGAYIYDKVFDYSGILNASARNIFGIKHILSFDIFSFWGGVFIFTLFLFPYLFIILISFFKKNINELIEISRTLGTNHYKIISYIILPLSKLPILTGLSMIIMEVINDFGVTSYLGIQTFTVSIFKAWFSMNDIQTASKLSSYLVPIIFLLLILSKKYSLKNPISYLNTREPSPIALTGFPAFLATSFCLFIFFISYLLPILILAYYSYFAFIHYPIWDTIFVLGQTIFLIFISTCILLILGLFVAYQTRQSNNLIYTEVFSLQYTLPSIIIAVSILNVFFQLESIHIIPKGATTNIQNSFVILVFAYIMRFMIISYNLAINAFKKINTHYQNVARTLGYSEFQTFVKLELPLILPSIIIGSSIIMIDLFKELPLTLFLSPFNFETPTTRTYNYIANEMFTESTPSALVLIIILSLLTYLLYKYSYSSKGKKS